MKFKKPIASSPRQLIRVVAIRVAEGEAPLAIEIGYHEA